MTSSSHVSEKYGIVRLDAVPSYANFHRDYLEANVPCILPPGLVADWRAHRWATAPGAPEAPSERSQLHPAFYALAGEFATQRVPVVIKRSSDGEEDRKETTLADAVMLLQQGKAEYIKDWHLFQQIQETHGVVESLPYNVPELFQDDWMNNVQPGEADFRFLYAGKRGSGTGLHRDDASYSWSTNIIGRKRWRMFPPSAAAGLRRIPSICTSQLAPDVAYMDARMKRGELGPWKEGKGGWNEWANSRAACVEIEQEVGETIFVPSGWYHEVENLTDCISINHNWCNSSNLLSVFEALCAAVDATEVALEDVQEMMRAQGGNWKAEWHETVQRVVEADQGWAWKGFWKMVKHALDHPPARERFSPDAKLVSRQVRDCVVRYQVRPERTWLDDESVVWLSRYCDEQREKQSMQ